MLAIFALLCVAHTAVAFSTTSIGDRLVNSYNVYNNLPITAADAVQAGWALNKTCDPDYGFSAAMSASGATQDAPVTLYFNGAGQVSGIGMHYYGKVSSLLVQRGFLKVVSGDVHRISVMFRSAQPSLCGASASPFPLGDRLTVNPDTINYSLPVLQSEAQAASWTNGSCFASMGYHHFYDLTSAPKMSWVADNLLPVVVMFHEGVINAVFFASRTVQQSLIFESHMWDRVPLPDFLMCKNWCDSACTWKDISVWSTGHFFFRDYSKVTCPGGCTIGCC